MRMLDLFCGAGLAAHGYWRSGRFSEIVGVDIENKKPVPYSFDFILGDCMNLDYDFLDQFDFFHASPPCQFYSKITPNRAKHADLIGRVLTMLVAMGKPFVIENVEGSSRQLRPNLSLRGVDFGLPIIRRRYFHIYPRPRMGLAPAVKLSTGVKVNLHGASYVSKSAAAHAFGLGGYPIRLDWLTLKDIEQGIPPIFTEWIASSMFSEKFIIA